MHAIHGVEVTESKKESLTSANVHVIVNDSYNSSNSNYISRDASIDQIFSQFTFYSSRHPTFFVIFML